MMGAKLIKERAFRQISCNFITFNPHSAKRGNNPATGQDNI
jgi:hypothetical protein